jgi:hypothetical protein
MAWARALGDDQTRALLMHDVDDRALSQQVLVPRILTHVGAALARGGIDHLITDRVPEILGDHQLVGCISGDHRGHLHRAIRLVADARPLDGDLAEGRLEGEGACPPPLDAGVPFAVPLVQDQFLIRLLDEDLEESALNFETGLMHVGLDLVGEMLVLMRHGQGHLQRQVERESLVPPVDGAARDGSLKAVGGAHGVSPYCNYGDPSCVPFYQPG